MSRNTKSSMWKNHKIPRGKHHNKTDTKTTVSLYLSKKVVEKARFHKLNLSRITEQALLSILDYLESSKPINMSKCESISQQHEKPRWPSWLGHRLGKAEVAGSNPARGSNVATETRLPGL